MNTSRAVQQKLDRKSTRLNSSHLVISYAVFCLKKKKNLLQNSYAQSSLHIQTFHMRSRHLVLVCCAPSIQPRAVDSSCTVTRDVATPAHQLCCEYENSTIIS